MISKKTHQHRWNFTPHKPGSVAAPPRFKAIHVEFLSCGLIKDKGIAFLLYCFIRGLYNSKYDLQNQ